MKASGKKSEVFLFYEYKLTTVQRSKLQCSAVQCSTVQYNIVQKCTVHRFMGGGEGGGEEEGGGRRFIYKVKVTLNSSVMRIPKLPVRL